MGGPNDLRTIALRLFVTMDLLAATGRVIIAGLGLDSVRWETTKKRATKYVQTNLLPLIESIGDVDYSGTPTDNVTLH